MAGTGNNAFLEASAPAASGSVAKAIPGAPHQAVSPALPAAAARAGEARHGTTGSGASNGTGGVTSGGSGAAVDAGGGGKARTTAGGTSAAKFRALSDGMSRYAQLVKDLVEAHKVYPLAARRSGRQGSCERRFVLARDGSLRRVETVTSCGHPFLDGAATRAITGVGKFPPFPEDFPGAEETFSTIFTFHLSER